MAECANTQKSSKWGRFINQEISKTLMYSVKNRFEVVAKSF